MNNTNRQFIGDKPNRGFTLLEVLISLLILAIGLLGLSALQITNFKDNLNAYNRSQAAQLSYDIIDRMRANTVAAQNYLGSFMDPAVANEQLGCITSAGCKATKMAENDLYQWQQNLTTLLPSGQGSITINGNTYTVSISWDENRDGQINSTDPAFKSSFQL